MAFQANPFQPLPSSSPLDVIRAAKDWSPHLPPEWRPVWILLATCYPNIRPDLDTLAEQCGKSRATVARYLRGLNDIGATVTERRGGGANTVAWRMLVIPETGMALPVSDAGPPAWVAQAHAVRERDQMESH